MFERVVFHHVCRLSLDDVCQDNSQLSRSMDQEHDEFMARRAMRIAQKDFSPATWDAFRAQVLYGRSAADTAEDLGISINAAAKAKCRVLKRIRQELQRLLDSYNNLALCQLLLQTGESV